MNQITFYGDRVLNEELVKSIILRHRPTLEIPIEIFGNEWTKAKISHGSFRVLLLIEPEAVLPKQYKTNVRERYNLVISMSPWRAERLEMPDWVYQPYSWVPRKFRFNNRLKNPVMVAASKFGNSSRSMYWLRRSLIHEMDKRGLPLDVYGPDWNMSPLKEIRMRIYSARQFLVMNQIPRWHESISHFQYRPVNYCGVTIDKMDTLQRYQTSIVIENDLDALSEKLFDCFEAGTIPIYVGPKFVELDFLESCLVRAEANPDSIIQVFKNLTGDGIQKRQAAIRSLHDHPEYLNRWHPDYISTQISRKILSRV
jgi:hypothetical protein